jgi:hypothetical protein
LSLKKISKMHLLCNPKMAAHPPLCSTWRLDTSRALSGRHLRHADVSSFLQRIFFPANLVVLLVKLYPPTRQLRLDIVLREAAACKGRGSKKGWEACGFQRNQCSTAYIIRLQCQRWVGH